MGHSAALLAFLVSVFGTSTVAGADVRTAIHVGAGLEGGGITAMRPDGVVEAGLAVDWYPGSRFGVGFAAEVVKRQTSEVMALADNAETRFGRERKFDVMARMRGRDGRFRGGVGAGVRVLDYQLEGTETVVSGIDMFRWDLEMVLARWSPGGLPRAISVDGWFSWTYGCYRGVVESRDGDVVGMKRELRCTDQLTTTYVVGVATSVMW